MPETTENASTEAGMIIEVIEPQKVFIDETEGKEIGEFEKIVDEVSSDEIGTIITTRKIVSMDQDEIIAKRIKDLKIKVALGTATTTEKSDLKLLIG